MEEKSKWKYIEAALIFLAGMAATKWPQLLGAVIMVDAIFQFFEEPVNNALDRVKVKF